MFSTTVNQFRKNIHKYLKDVSENFETLFLNDKNDKNYVVLSLDEYNSMQATLHELSSKKNEERLDSAVNKINNGDYFEKDLIES